jgi:hypothetical protein
VSAEPNLRATHVGQRRGVFGLDQREGLAYRDQVLTDHGERLRIQFAGMALVIGGSGAFRSVATHALISSAELVDVLRKAAAARPG